MKFKKTTEVMKKWREKKGHYHASGYAFRLVK